VEKLKERIASLESRTEGLKLDTAAGELLREILVVLKEMANTVAELQNNQQEMDQYLRTVDEDLTNLENDVYGDDFVEEDLDEQELICPNCHDGIYIDEDCITVSGDQDLDKDCGERR